MIKNYKYALLLALLCSAQIPSQAGFFYDFCRNTWRGKVDRLYPFNVALNGFDIFKEIRSELAMPIDNSAVKEAYPHALAYTQEQLQKAGINPDRIEIRESSSLVSSFSGTRKLALPLSMLETTPPESQQKRNQAELITAHEIKHLQGRDTQKEIVAAVLILTSIEICARKFPFMRTKFLGTFFKTICSQVLLTSFRHLEEYGADSAALAQFQHNKQALLDYAVVWLNNHQAETQEAVAAKPTVEGKVYAINFFYNPIKVTGFHWLVDTHGTNLARANRFIKAAGLPCNQWLLARMLKRQFLNDFAKDPKEQAKEFDASFVIDQLKKLDAVKMPYPFETYGQ